MPHSEFAPAKINLTLEILGRRRDGYHELRSLVAFAQDVGDEVSWRAGDAGSVETAGPFANGIVGSNLVDKAVAAFSAVAPDVPHATVSLLKKLPVASGIGGGSADAAATLRLLSAASTRCPDVDLETLARSLGADVPVCVRSRPVVMTGVGETLEDVELPGDLHAVLVNPLVSVPADKTAQVFRTLNAPALAEPPAREPLPRFASVADVVAYAGARGNDLQAPACTLIPAIATVLEELGQTGGCRLAQLSGAGPTCFALFESEQHARAAASALQARQPGWWIQPTRLG